MKKKTYTIPSDLLLKLHDLKEDTGLSIKDMINKALMEFIINESHLQHAIRLQELETGIQLNNGEKE